MSQVERQDIEDNVIPPFKIHFAPSGEWGSTRVNCGRYYTTDVAHTGNKDKVTCKYCLQLFNEG